MSVDRFRFVSPGVFINEIDQSQLPQLVTTRTGPAIIGQASRGPAFRPVQISSFDEFVQTFGNPSPGFGSGQGDAWRDGADASPTYGAYAAQAYLANNTPVTFIRLLGAESPQKTSAGRAGWEVKNASGNPYTEAAQGGVYGLFICNSASAGTNLEGSLAAVWYLSGSNSIALSGSRADALGSNTAAINTLMQTVGSNKEFKVYISGASGEIKNTTFNFKSTSPRYIRKVFNTNPILLNPFHTNDNSREHYFLGESFDRNINDLFDYGTDDLYGMIVGLGSGSATSEALAADFRMGYQKPETPPIISQWLDPARSGSFDLNGSGVTELFSVAARDEAEWLQNNIKVSITDIAPSQNPDYYGYGTFTLMVRNMADNDETPVILEQWNNLSLDPGSRNYIAKRIGTKYVEFDSTNKRFRSYGEYDNLSRYVRVKMDPNLESNGDASLLPFGFKGVPKYKGFSFASGSAVVSDITGPPVAATLTDILNIPASLADGDQFTVNVPAAGGGADTDITVRLVSGTPSDGTPDEVQVQMGGSEEATRNRLRGAIDGNAGVVTGVYKYGSGAGDYTVGVAGLAAAAGTGADDLTITATTAGTVGNSIVFTDVVGDMVEDGASSSPATLAGGISGPMTSPFVTLTTDPTLKSSTYPFGGMPSGTSTSIAWPFLPQRLSASDGQLVDGTNAFWGLQTTAGRESAVFDSTIRDLICSRPASQVDGWNVQKVDGSGTQDAWMERGPGFSLDNLVYVATGPGAFHSGSNISYAQSNPLGAYRAGTSMTAASASYEEVLNQGYDRFTVPLVGGFDGLDNQEKDPFNNTRALGGVNSPASDTTTNAMYYSLLAAVDSLADPEFVDMNLAVVPGIWQRNVTNRLLRVCQDRADAMAVIDLEGDYTAAAEGSSVASRPDPFNSRVGSVANAVTYIKDRKLNNSYGAAYYPWVQIQDTLNGARVWVPPSVVALGTYASSEARSDVWFAPAGFNRGGLSQGSAGLPVLGVIERLTSKQRDSLYEVSINPIATFPAEGIVIFGQKTLQATQSALDRINVRRLLIFLKRRISRIATTILFDPNIQVTWNRFLSSVEPLLRSVKSRFGLAEYRVILDTTTTTPDLVDRNIMYAKVFLKPTRAIEFIALDFIITRTGASFND
jgi:hypothetical protein